MDLSLVAEQFHDERFLRVRRRVALLRLPHAEPDVAAALRVLIALYDEILGETAGVN